MNDAPDARTAPDSGDGFPEGWQLGADTWDFHRQFFARLGRPAARGEYSAIIFQIRKRTAPKVGRFRHRITLLDGSSLIVRGDYQRLYGIEAPNWSPPPPKARARSAPPAPVPQPRPEARAPPIAPPAPAPQPRPEARAPPIASPPPRQPLRASTLTLGNPAAAAALAERLRRAGISGGRAAS